MRNYKAMGDDKLEQCLLSLETGRGDAANKVRAKGEDLFDHLEAATKAAKDRGWKVKTEFTHEPAMTPEDLVFAPMLCHDTDTIPDGDWQQEAKFDGWRFLFHRTHDRVRSYSGRNAQERTGQPSEIELVLMDMPPGTVIDAEVIVPGGKSPDVARNLAHDGPLQAIVFDCLYAIGDDVRHLPWRDRRVVLEKLAENFDRVHVDTSMTYPQSEDLHESFMKQGFEGSVFKRTESPYVAGRSRDWLKLKPQQTADALITGFKDGQGARRGLCGAFYVAILGSGIETTVGTLDNAQRLAIEAAPQNFLGHVLEFRHHGIDPESGKPRHPVFSRMRPDLDQL